MDFTPYILGATVVTGAVLAATSIGWTRHFIQRQLPTKQRNLSLIYWAADGQRFSSQFQIGEIRWSKDTNGEKHLVFEAIDRHGVAHVLAAERVLAAYAENGNQFQNFFDYLVHLRRKDVLKGLIRSPFTLGKR